MSHQDDLRRWDDRRREIYAYLIGPANGSLSATARAFKISRQRVYQIRERITKDGEHHARGSAAPTSA